MSVIPRLLCPSRVPVGVEEEGASSYYIFYLPTLARMLLMRLLWWILESTHMGGFRRLAAVTSLMPASLSCPKTTNGSVMR